MRELLTGGLLICLLPMTALAELKEGSNWRDCAQDSDCILIDGTCNKTAINRAHEYDARMFYNQEHEHAKCVDQFWLPKQVIAQCHIGSCSIAAKPAAKKKSKTWSSW